MATRSIPSAEEVMGWMDSLSTWGWWGPDDQLGMLNYVTPEKRLEAMQLVKKGITVSCSRVIKPEYTPDYAPVPPIHFMASSGDNAPDQGFGGASDFIGMNIHGFNMTHIDTPAHRFWNGKMYNGIDRKFVSNRDKATKGGVDVLEDGIVTRGVLLDIARVRGVEWMGPGDGIFPEDLDAAEKAQGVTVRQGDALLYRTGAPKTREAQGPPIPPGRPGMHAASMPWLFERKVALIAADAATDVDPTGYPGLPLGLPVHGIAILAMGLWVLDGGNYEQLAEICARENRWEFLFVMSPLRWEGATGSPVNPLAIL